MLTVACVKVGNKYPFDHVIKLKNMVARHLPIEHRFVCLTDRPMRYIDIQSIDVSFYGLQGWWSKMCLFNREIMPAGRILYFDLDTVIVDDLLPLAELVCDFGICANFTRAAGNRNWPCSYGSCVMTIGPRFGQDIWNEFETRAHGLIENCRHGDQEAIESIYPQGFYLQDYVPPGFFLNYRDLSTARPSEASVVVFGGHNKPDNCDIPWVQEAWR